MVFCALQFSSFVFDVDDVMLPFLFELQFSKQEFLVSTLFFSSSAAAAAAFVVLYFNIISYAVFLCVCEVQELVHTILMLCYR